jgi:hypothetical protein
VVCAPATAAAVNSKAVVTAVRIIALIIFSAKLV